MGSLKSVMLLDNIPEQVWPPVFQSDLLAHVRHSVESDRGCGFRRQDMTSKAGCIVYDIMSNEATENDNKSGINLIRNATSLACRVERSGLLAPWGWSSTWQPRVQVQPANPLPSVTPHYHPVSCSNWKKAKLSFLSAESEFFCWYVWTIRRHPQQASSDSKTAVCSAMWANTTGLALLLNRTLSSWKKNKKSSRKIPTRSLLRS